MLGVLFRVKRVFPTNYADFMKKSTPPPLPLLHGSSSTLTQTKGGNLNSDLRERKVYMKTTDIDRNLKRFDKMLKRIMQDLWNLQHEINQFRKQVKNA